MHHFLHDIKYTLSAFLKRNNLVLFILACVTTALIVINGLDAYYFNYFQNTNTYSFFKFAGIIGFITPLLLGILLLGIGYILKNKRTRTAAWLIAEATFFGWLFSSLLKVFTGRIGPPYGIVPNIIELSHTFRFGIYEGGIFWGWPSSHTTTAVAGAIAIIIYYRDKKWVAPLALFYASYIAIGASMSFHWLSDVTTGFVLGLIIGIAVGENFKKVLEKK